MANHIHLEVSRFPLSALRVLSPQEPDGSTHRYLKSLALSRRVNQFNGPTRNRHSLSFSSMKSEVLLAIETQNNHISIGFDSH